MWLICALLSFACWGTADLFYKIGNYDKGEYNHLKTGIFVGLVMGIHAFIYLFINRVDVNIIDVIKYLPISLCYISSMVIGYRGLKYLELSISSPVQNTSGVITAILLLIFFKETLALPAYIAFFLIFIGIIIISILEIKENKEKRKEYNKTNAKKKVFVLTILFPLVYCLIDGMGTFLDAIYLDKLKIIRDRKSVV